MQAIISLLNSRSYRQTLSFPNLISDIELIKAALFLNLECKLTVTLIRNGLRMCEIDTAWRYRQESEVEFTVGVWLSERHLGRVMRALSRFIPNEVVKLWTQRYIKHEVGYATPVEFLYLLANSIERPRALSVLPSNAKSILPENGLFPLHPLSPEHSSPDRWAQHIANTAVRTFRPTFILEGDSPSSRTARRAQHLATASLDTAVEAIMKTPKLRREIRRTLKLQLGRVMQAKASRSPRLQLRALKEDSGSPLLSQIRATEDYQTRYQQEEKRLRSVLHSPKQPRRSREWANCSYSVKDSVA